MKHIKKFENINKSISLNIGDYILVDVDDMINNGLSNFIENNVGKVYDIKHISSDLKSGDNSYVIYIEYGYIPNVIEYKQNTDITRHIKIYKNNLISIYDRYITWYSSKNKTDIEIIANTRKYNL